MAGTYTDKQKIAIYKYREANRDKINEQAKKDYQNTKTKPEQIEKRRAYAKAYYQRKKEREEKKYWDRIIESSDLKN